MKSRIWLSLAHMSGREQEFIQEAFDTNWVVPLGPNVNAFEKSLRDFLIGDGGLQIENEGMRIVALSAGTAALHLGLILLGVQPGDEVICQSFTFAASANPIAYLEATPVFVDSEKETWNMDPVLLEEAIKERLEKTGKLPKAIIPVHLYGMPGKMDEVMEVANCYGIPVLEDSAEALGSEYKGRKCGTFGEYGVLSFNGNKMITTSGGGALICPNEEKAKRALFYATQAREQAPHYQHEKIGYNYRMSNICAGIGRGQMFVLDEHVTRRRAIHDLYVKLLAGVKGVKVMCQPEGEGFNSNYWLTCITVEPEEAGFTREDVRLALDEENIESRPLWKPMHLQPVFKDAPYYGNGTSERLFEIGLCLPSGPTLTDEDVERVTKVVKQLSDFRF
ncbi:MULTISPECIES: DegT/DnrJ/EryC1/StrS family aminotransferase [Butyricimonas]|jgi:putative degT/dnrJ/eryC1/strS family aminotransferase protein|uniref:dTDP-4-amino-4,6-dideoxygalactose transaminase n=1 Tax=Butyricimonas faecihominis TaxID=1472416 RepID=A0A7W6MY05_9BACT|nr:MULTISPECIES: DegT/DnrJ/EryC1/StrS family aminotransferase [Butyricimonas]KAB1508467.1 DegT/DnrJ/EryC1/StrS family aminotransferase [Butyricimonas faecihominis]MBB4025547.1 dTDP-4-amino-4,6-dideoxygalactose transaminase [Butyricimonas faecihominis]WOF10365.1 DegT/DnrJ/EryC1/StrS family aminotransferase [Butyricimonas faecihominis]BEI57260.1 aminotransferase class I/II-fold pyridoxal phosphate-dependent enzyme [Butyricimonas faecihominis]GGJ41926.1 pyridoxal phosphate-dependent aminotransfer